MFNQDLEHVAQDLVADGKGLLAADETVSTLSRRLLARGIESTPDSRRAYREMLFSTRGIGECISGVILHEETIRQRSARGRTFPELLAQQGILAGIKVDRGANPLAGSSAARASAVSQSGPPGRDRAAAVPAGPRERSPES